MPQPIAKLASVPIAGAPSAAPARPRSGSDSFQTTLDKVKDTQAKKPASVKPAKAETPKPSRGARKAVKAEAQPKAKKTKPPHAKEAEEEDPEQSSDHQAPTDRQPESNPHQEDSVSDPAITDPAALLAQLHGDSPDDSSHQSASTPIDLPLHTASIPRPIGARSVEPAASKANVQKTTVPPDENVQADATQVSQMPSPAEQVPASQPATTPPKDLRSAIGSLSRDAGASEQATVQTPTAQPSGPSDDASSSDGGVAASATQAPADQPAPATPSRSTDDGTARFDLPQLPTDLRDANPASRAQPAKPPALSPEAQFAEVNHPKIVSAIHGQLLPDGGTMSIRLDPPELGAMHIRVEIHGGVVTASFEASNDRTAKLLSHSLGDLKSALESQGVSVEKLHVTQTSREQASTQNNDRHDSPNERNPAAQQDQQRRELMRRMWRKLLNGQDPLDLVA